jgi:hypothetical protein
MRQFAGIVMLAGAVVLAASAQSGLELIQPDAGLVMGIEWHKIVESGLGGELTEQVKKNPMASMPGMQALQDALLHDLDSLVIAVPANALANAKGNAKPPILLVVKGRFHVDQLRALIMQKNPHTETYRSVEIIATPDNAPKADGENQIAFLDANTILGGDRTQLRSAIDRAKSGHLTGVRAGLLSGVAALASKNDIWMIFDLPPGALKEAPPMAAQMFAAVKGAELGLSFQQGFGLLLNIRTQDADSAISMAQTLQGLVAMGAMIQSQSPQAAELVKKIRITPESSHVSLSISLDRSEVQKMIEEAKTGATRAASAPPESRVYRAPEHSGPKSIRITGLDSGPVDIPVASKK